MNHPLRREFSSEEVADLHFNKKMTLTKIAEHFKTHRATIRKRLKRIGLKRRTFSDYPQLDDKDWLVNQYHVLRKPVNQMAQEIGCSTANAHHAIRKFGIQIRKRVAHNYSGGRKNACPDCGKNKCKNRVRCMKCAHFNKRGENHHAYKPPHLRKSRDLEILRKRIEFREWRSSVYARDNWTCLKCGMRGGTLHPHHLDGFHWCVERRYDVSNGATLCEKCHDEFHDAFGNKNNTEPQFIQFMAATVEVN